MPAFRSHFILRLAALLWLAALTGLSAGEASTPAELGQHLNDFVGQPRFTQAAWGIEVVSLDTGKTLAAINAHRLLKPASNTKLYTAALALQRLGTNFQATTSLRVTAPVADDGALSGGLVIYGRGDPSLCARFHQGNTESAVQLVADTIFKAGIKHISGGLIGDESYFRGVPFGSGWTWDDLQYYYGAGVSALNLEDNVVNLDIQPGSQAGDSCTIVLHPDTDYLQVTNLTTTGVAGTSRRMEITRAPGSNLVRITGTLPLGGAVWHDAVSVERPALWFLHQLKAALTRRGVVVDGPLRVINEHDPDLTEIEKAHSVELASIPSVPLTDIVHQTLKQSQNLYAQLLLLQVGKLAEAKRAASSSPSESGPTTEELGIAELHRFLTEINVDAREVLIEDGAGLSRTGLVTPHATVTLLRYMSQHPQAAVFRDSLPVAGVDGTLQHRLHEPPAFQNLRAKTGSLRYVNTLSGYVTTRAGEHLAFSLMLNNYLAAPGHSGTAELDTIAQWLAGLSQRSQP